MNILAIGNKIISETLNLPDELRPTEREIAAMVSFLHKLSSKASPELAALREAGEKMKDALDSVKGDLWKVGREEAEAAIEAWKAANK